MCSGISGMSLTSFIRRKNMLRICRPASRCILKLLSRPCAAQRMLWCDVAFWFWLWSFANATVFQLWTTGSLFDHSDCCTVHSWVVREHKLGIGTCFRTHPCNRRIRTRTLNITEQNTMNTIWTLRTWRDQSLSQLLTTHSCRSILCPVKPISPVLSQCHSASEHSQCMLRGILRVASFNTATVDQGTSDQRTAGTKDQRTGTREPSKTRRFGKPS